MQTQSQTDANKKWQAKNREYTRYLSARSASRGFITTKATLDDIIELEELIAKRKEFLKNNHYEPPKKSNQ